MPTRGSRAPPRCPRLGRRRPGDSGSAIPTRRAVRLLSVAAGAGLSLPSAASGGHGLAHEFHHGRTEDRDRQARRGSTFGAARTPASAAEQAAAHRPAPPRRRREASRRLATTRCSPGTSGAMPLECSVTTTAPTWIASSAPRQSNRDLVVAVQTDQNLCLSQQRPAGLPSRRAGVAPRSGWPLRSATGSCDARGHARRGSGTWFAAGCACPGT